jgi:hypothetical protein
MAAFTFFFLFAGKKIEFSLDYKDVGGVFFKIFRVVALTMICFSCIIVFLNALFTPLWDIDSFALWGLKSKVIFFNPLDKERYFCAPEYGFSHLDYPLLVPFLNAGIYCAIGKCSQSFGKFLYIPLFISFAICLYHFFLRKNGKNAAIGLTAVLLSCPAVLQWSASGTADIYLTVFYSVAVFSSIRYLEEKSSFFLASALMADAFMIFTKNEGLPIAAINMIFLFCFSFFCKFSGKEKMRILGGIFICAVAVSPWLIWSIGILKIHENYPARIFEIFHICFWSKFYEIAGYFFMQAGNIYRWGLVWFLVAVFFIVAGFKGKIGASFVFALLTLLANLALYVFIFMISPWDVNYLAASSLERLFLHLSAPAFALCSCSLQIICAKTKRVLPHKSLENDILQ